MGTECDLGLEFADNAICDVAVGTVGKLEEMLKTGSMIKWGRIVSSLSDKDFTILLSPGSDIIQKKEVFLCCQKKLEKN